MSRSSTTVALLRLFFVAFVVTSTSACVKFVGPEVDNNPVWGGGDYYFPLEVGNQWVYDDVKVYFSGSTYSEMDTITILSTEWYYLRHSYEVEYIGFIDGFTLAKYRDLAVLEDVLVWIERGLIRDTTYPIRPEAFLYNAELNEPYQDMKNGELEVTMELLDTGLTVSLADTTFRNCVKVLTFWGPPLDHDSVQFYDSTAAIGVYAPNFGKVRETIRHYEMDGSTPGPLVIDWEERVTLTDFTIHPKTEPTDSLY